MNLVRHHGLDLPIYPAEEVLYNKEQYREADLHGKPTFVRTVRTSGPPETLAERLSRADWCFQQLAKLCKIQIVPHIWGLCKDIPEILYERRLIDGIIPKGYLPVAEVAVIEPVGDIPADSISSFQKGLTRYSRQVVSVTDHPYTDTRIGQVMYGTRAGEDETPQAWYVDIEPLVGKQHLALANGIAFTNAEIIHG